MGYTTEFTGSFTVNPPLSPEHAEYLRAFQNTRRMKRDPEKAERLSDPIRLQVGLPIGDDGCFFVGGLGFAGQGHDSSVIDYNRPPNGQPGLWCGWEPSKDGARIEWNGREKFYDYVEWLEYLVEVFLHSWDYTLNGEVEWQGEEASDFGKIVVTDNKVRTLKGKRVYVEPSEG